MTKFFTLIIVALMTTAYASAQVFNYTFTSAASGTYTAIAGGATTHTGAFGANTAPVSVTIPAFKYYGFTYTTAKIYPNGWLQLGNNPGIATSTPIGGGFNPQPYAYATNAICAFAGFFGGTASSEVRYQTVSNEFVVQWTSLKNDGSSTAATISVQARLNTTTGVIRYVYNNAVATGVGLNLAQIGIRRSVVPGDCRLVSALYQNIGDWTTPVVHSNVTNVDSGYALVGTGTAGVRYPNNGHSFTFTPPADCNASLNIASVTLNNIAGTGVVCKGQRIAIRAFNLPASSGLQYRWESSVNTSFPYTYTPVSGTFLANDTTYELTTDTLMRNRVFQLKITCLATGLTYTTNPLAITVTDCNVTATQTNIGVGPVATSGVIVWRNGNNTDDNLSNDVSIGFPITVRGRTFSNVKISTNGFVTFDDANDASHNGAGSEFGNSPVFTVGVSSPNISQVLSPYYSNLTCATNDNTAASLAASIKCQATGTSPRREFKISWTNMKFAGTPNATALNFGITLFENVNGVNAIEYFYGNMKWHTGAGSNSNLYQTYMGILSKPNPALEATYNNPVAGLNNNAFLLHTADSLAFSTNFQNLTRGFRCSGTYLFFPNGSQFFGARVLVNNPVTPLYPRDNNFTPATAIPLAASAGSCTFNATCSSIDRIYQNTLGTPATAGACTNFDDGWFRFTPASNSTAINISVRSVGILDPIVSIYRTNLTVVAGYSCINATGEGGTETLNIPAGTLPVGSDYFLRVNRAGSNPSADGFSICYDGTAALPINLLEFTGKLDASNTAQLQWKAEKATNFSHFEIEHSVDGSAWAKAGSVSYADASSQYHFNHNNIAKGNNYYRLKQVDKDGRFEYSRVVVLNNKAGKIFNLVMQGNLVNDKVLFNLQTTTADVVAITIRNSNGQKMLQNSRQQLAAGSSAFSYSINNYAAGVYYIEAISQTGSRITAKFIKQ